MLSLQRSNTVSDRLDMQKVVFATLWHRLNMQKVVFTTWTGGLLARVVTRPPDLSSLVIIGPHISATLEPIGFQMQK